MKSAPNSKSNLDRAITRFAGSDARAVGLRFSLACAIVAQMIGEGVVKGGSGLRYRFGEKLTRVTTDLDTAWSVGLDEFIKNLKSRLAQSWNGFTGEVLIEKQAAAKGVPFEYLMQRCTVKLSYRGTIWYGITLEISHNEIGDADEYDEVPLPNEIGELFDFLCLPRPAPVRVMKLEYQIAQKLHGASSANSGRAHDLIDLQIIVTNNAIDWSRVREICHKLFYYRRMQPWPPAIIKGEGWDKVYNERRGTVPVLPTVDEAIAWTNDLIAKIEASTYPKPTATT